ncbi:Phospholipid phosphatase-related protein type 4 [Liparis tanakae]|uniref:Phospholipid phosphatase-related protein type 4 n=1 Tax=Liparis tanakae TaxID=230148 RepID=A0A4Z2F697_9TELE|nr:Phospholipid phosphatase-related protein type 4 [Liparis tanakae]
MRLDPLPILVSSVVSLYLLEVTEVFRPSPSGFVCHDRSLSLPYVEPHREVVPLLVLLSLAFAGPAVTIMIGEAILFCCVSRRRSGGGGGAEANINAAGCNFNSFIRRAVRFVGVHAFGLCATALVTDVLQLATGAPTPFFLTVCKPDYAARNLSCEQNPYVMEDVCSGADAAAITQGRKSFPSQHATLASFAAVYVSSWPRPRLAPPTLSPAHPYDTEEDGAAQISVTHLSSSCVGLSSLSSQECGALCSRVKMRVPCDEGSSDEGSP